MVAGVVAGVAGVATRIPLDTLLRRAGRNADAGIMENARLYFPAAVDYAERAGHEDTALRVLHEVESMPGRTTQQEIALIGFVIDGPIAHGSTLEECFDKDAVPHVLKPLGGIRDGAPLPATMTRLQTYLASLAGRRLPRVANVTLHPVTNADKKSDQMVLYHAPLPLHSRCYAGGATSCHPASVGPHICWTRRAPLVGLRPHGLEAGQHRHPTRRLFHPDRPR